MRKGERQASQLGMATPLGHLRAEETAAIGQPTMGRPSKSSVIVLRVTVVAVKTTETMTVREAREALDICDVDYVTRLLRSGQLVGWHERGAGSWTQLRRKAQTADRPASPEQTECGCKAGRAASGRAGEVREAVNAKQRKTILDHLEHPALGRWTRPAWQASRSLTSSRNGSGSS